MSDLSGLCKHGVSRAKPCGDCMGSGLQDIVDAYNEGKLHGGVKDAYARLFDRIKELEAENAELRRTIADLNAHEEDMSKLATPSDFNRAELSRMREENAELRRIIAESKEMKPVAGVSAPSGTRTYRHIVRLVDVGEIPSGTKIYTDTRWNGERR